MMRNVSMRRAGALLVGIALALGSSVGCAMNQKKVQKEVTSGAPVNCATAQGDIRVLESEKAHVTERILEGATAILPAFAVVGILSGTEGTKLEVAIGTYNEQIDARIKEIKSTCGL